MNKLKLLRTERGESLEKIAKYLNVTIQTVSNYENEKRDMSPDTIIKLSEYFKVSTDYLLGKSDVRNPEKVNINDADVAFASGVKALNETNKMIIKNTLEALLAKQEQDNKNTEDK
jgi:transcriptional regulator with XRE-family HTH domain